MAEKRTILIVEDERDLRETLRGYLRNQGYETFCADGFEQALAQFCEHHVDLLLLDVKLPDGDGFDLARKIRKESDVPIIFLTCLAGEKDVERGFGAGGDDYLRKPFALSELRMRIEAIFRRLYANRESIELGEELLYDIRERRLYRKGEPVHLKPKEIRLLELFLRHPGETIGRERIYDELYAYGEEPCDASVRTFVYRLRKLLPPGSIETVRERGYRYVPGH